MARILSGFAFLGKIAENTALATLSIDIDTIGNWCQCVSGQISIIGGYYGQRGKNFIRNSCTISKLLVALPNANICNT